MSAESPFAVPSDDELQPDDECWQCGGIGMVAGCFEDTCCGEDCDPDDAETCCSPRRCDICNPATRLRAALKDERT